MRDKTNWFCKPQMLEEAASSREISLDRSNNRMCRPTRGRLPSSSCADDEGRRSNRRAGTGERRVRLETGGLEGWRARGQRREAGGGRAVAAETAWTSRVVEPAGVDTVVVPCQKLASLLRVSFSFLLPSWSSLSLSPSLSFSPFPRIIGEEREREREREADTRIARSRSRIKTHILSGRQ